MVNFLNSKASERIFSWQKVTTISLSLQSRAADKVKKVYNCRGSLEKKKKKKKTFQGKASVVGKWGGWDDEMILGKHPEGAGG